MITSPDTVRPTWRGARWAPRARPRGIYCSPACGSGCKRSWYDHAVRAAEELAKRMGEGWVPRVWENLGWFYEVHCGCRRIGAMTRSAENMLADWGITVVTGDGQVDRYFRLEDNLQAIYHVIEAERTKLRHGGLNLVRAAFRGYAALPPPGAETPWHEVLGVAPTATKSDISAAYRKAAEAVHPDRGGSDAAMARLNLAREQAMREARA